MNRLALMVLKNLHRVPYLYGKLCHYAKHTDEYPEAEKWAHIHHILELAVKAGNLELEVTGLENLTAAGDGFLMYANHQGLFDVVAIAATCEVPIGAVLKKELAEVPLLKQIRLCTHSFAMDREDVRQSLEVIRAVTEEVRKGRNYLIFPEGTRSKNGNLMGEFHGGSFRCAVKAKCPIVPIAFIDSFKVLDQKGSDKLHVECHYLEPIRPEEYAGLKTVELADLVKNRIAAKIEERTGITQSFR